MTADHIPEVKCETCGEAIYQFAPGQWGHTMYHTLKDSPGWGNHDAKPAQPAVSPSSDPIENEALRIQREHGYGRMLDALPQQPPMDWKHDVPEPVQSRSSEPLSIAELWNEYGVAVVNLQMANDIAPAYASPRPLMELRTRIEAAVAATERTQVAERVTVIVTRYAEYPSGDTIRELADLVEALRGN